MGAVVIYFSKIKHTSAFFQRKDITKKNKNKINCLII